MKYKQIIGKNKPKAELSGSHWRCPASSLGRKGEIRHQCDRLATVQADRYYQAPLLWPVESVPIIFWGSDLQGKALCFSQEGIKSKK